VSGTLVVQGVWPVLLGISGLPPGTFGDSHFTPHWSEMVTFQNFKPSTKFSMPCSDKKLII